VVFGFYAKTVGVIPNDELNCWF